MWPLRQTPQHNLSSVFLTDARKRVGVAEASGRVVRVAWSGFRRERSSQHLTQGHLAQRVAQRPVRPQGFHNLGRVVLLPPQLLDQSLGFGSQGRSLASCMAPASSRHEDARKLGKPRRILAPADPLARI
jgi:hypothetical protein